MHILEGSDGQRIVTSSKNCVRTEEDGTGVYADHVTKKQYRVSFSDRKLVESTDLEDSLDGKKQELVELISNVLRKYLDEFFSKGSHLYGRKLSRSLCPRKFTSLRFQLQDFESGEQIVVSWLLSAGFWNSEWTLDLDSNKVSGGVSLFSYLFEESNNLFFNDDRTE